MARASFIARVAGGLKQFMASDSSANASAGNLLALNSSAQVDATLLPAARGGSASRRAVADAATTITATDYQVAYTSLTQTRAVTLPAASSVSGQIFIIKDETGNAGLYPITITGTVDNATNKSVAAAYGVMRFYSNGNTYFSL